MRSLPTFRMPRRSAEKGDSAREIRRRHVAGDLIDARDGVAADPGGVLVYQFLVRRLVDAERLDPGLVAHHVAVLPRHARERLLRNPLHALADVLHGLLLGLAVEALDQIPRHHSSWRCL